MQAQLGYGPAFVTAFKSGAVMGFSLVAFGVLMLFVLINLFALKWTDAYDGNGLAAKHMYEAIAGYGLGGSSIALFGRVGGGICR
jgi:inorganic pyrophosphatase